MNSLLLSESPGAILILILIIVICVANGKLWLAGAAAALLAYLFFAYRLGPKPVPVAPYAVMNDAKAEYTILSPAAGRIDVMHTVGNKTIIEFKLDPFDIHVQRAPIDGLATMSTKNVLRTLPWSLWQNQSALNVVTPSHNNYKVITKITNGPVTTVVTQISGKLFPRAVSLIGDGHAQVRAGDLIGLIKLGLRVRLEIVPTDTNQGPIFVSNVAIGDRVVPGTIIGTTPRLSFIES
jgi:phosphatidylserine decarboxylase